MTINIKKNIDETCWKELKHSGNSFLNYYFFHALEKSNVIGKESGWEPRYFEAADISILYSFIKNHSYGEYIFDWDWAHAYHHYGLPYYPKMTSMIPFTPATSSHFLGETSKKVMEHYEEFYQSNSLSSSHLLFLTPAEIDFFKSYDYIIRESFQYHFKNEEYQSFDDFLAKLKNKKAKQIKKERDFTEDIKIESFTGDQLTPSHAVDMFKFYQSTIHLKQAISYLNLDFFKLIFEKLKNNIYYVQASQFDDPIAGSLFFYDSESLYGRYWGATKDIPNLHFELCYYRGIDFCIEKKIKTFEAGAQGEHKIARGFRPTKTYSAHKIKNAEFHQAISQYIIKEKSQLNNLILSLNERQPFLENIK